jgi:hypothetical protein
MMLARQAKPIETSSPDGVESPLWQARQRSDVWKRESNFLWLAAMHIAGKNKVRSAGTAAMIRRATEARGE